MSTEHSYLEFPLDIDIVDFLKQFNRRKGKQLPYKDVEKFISGLKLSFEEKIQVMISVYTTLVDQQGEIKYPEYSLEFVKELQNWVQSKENECLKKLMELGKKNQETLTTELSVLDKLRYKFNSKTKQLDEELKKIRKRISQRQVCLIRTKCLTKEFISLCPHLFVHKKNLQVAIAQRTSPETKKFPMLQNELSTREGKKRKSMNSGALQDYYNILLTEFVEDIMFAIAKSFGRLTKEQSKMSQKEQYCKMFCYVADLLNLNKEIVQHPKVDFGIYFLQSTGSTKDMELDKLHYSLNSKTPLSLQILLDIAKTTPDKIYISNIVEKLLLTEKFNKFVLRKLLWMSDHGYYYDYLTHAIIKHPRSQDRIKTRKLLEYKMLSVSQWNGDIDF